MMQDPRLTDEEGKPLTRWSGDGDNPDVLRAESRYAEREHEALRSTLFGALFPDTGGRLVAHAHRELNLAGMYGQDADYNGVIADNVVDLLRVFASQGHSGNSAMLVIELFEKLARFETLSPNNHEQYHDVSEASGTPPGTTLQDTRDSTWFSNDGGKSWYCIEEREPLDAQIKRLADFIMAEVPGEPSASEGAVDTAIRWMRAQLAPHGDESEQLARLSATQLDVESAARRAAAPPCSCGSFAEGRLRHSDDCAITEWMRR